MPDAIEAGLYLLTPTHVGSGAAAGAIDLPIARERHTGHPYLPATALKGATRSHARQQWGATDERLKRLFGSEPPQKESRSEDTEKGDLTFTDGHLLAFPVRSLSAAFYWVTCPLVIQRWSRMRRALKLTKEAGKPLEVAAGTSTFKVDGALVLEDHVVSGLTDSQALKTVAAAWAALLPKGDGIASRLPQALICLPDSDFSHLVRSTTPVNARVQLTPGKTTDLWISEEGEKFEGNLWYEETLPPDCLFSLFLSGRGGAVASADKLLDILEKPASPFQIGGNETVGQGLCQWTFGGRNG